MCYWNYHLIRTHDVTTGQPKVKIHEVYYNNGDKPRYFNPEPAIIEASSPEAFLKIQSGIAKRSILNAADLQEL